MGLLALIGARVELAEAEVAVGGEGLYLQLLSKREHVTVVAVCLIRGSLPAVTSPRRRAHARSHG